MMHERDERAGTPAVMSFALAMGLSITPGPVRGADPEPAADAGASAAADEVALLMVVRTELGETDATAAPLVRKQVRERLHAQGFREVRGAERGLTVVVRWANAGTAERRDVRPRVLVRDPAQSGAARAADDAVRAVRAG